MKKPKARPKPKTECFYCKGNGHWKRNCPKYLADKKDGKVNKGILHIHVIDVYFSSVCSNPFTLLDDDEDDEGGRKKGRPDGN